MSKNSFRAVNSLAFLLLILMPLSVFADQIDDYLKAQMQKNHVPGLAVAVVRNGKIIKLKGYGVATLEWDQPATPDTVFQIASATKPLTGIVLMTLVDEKRVALDDKVSKYLPDAPDAWAQITIRHLTAHSSGIPDNVQVDENASLEEYVKAAYKLPLAYQTGAKSAYGFADFVVLSHIIEKISGQSFVQFMNTRLFKRFGLSSAKFDYSSNEGGVRQFDVVKNRANVYLWENGKYRNYLFSYPERGYSAGGLFSSVRDLAGLAVALDEGKLLSAESTGQMWSRDTLADGSLNTFGAGWVVDTYHGRKIVGHSGGPALADILRFPDEKLTIIVLTNGQRLFPYLAKGVADLFLPPPLIIQVSGIEDTDKDLTRIVRQVLVEGARDKIDESLFTAEAKGSLVPGFRRFGLPYFIQFDALRSLVLLEHREKEDGIVRRYRAVYGNKAVIWTFEFDRAKKIKNLEPKSE